MRSKKIELNRHANGPERQKFAKSRISLQPEPLCSTENLLAVLGRQMEQLIQLDVEFGYNTGVSGFDSI